MNQGSDTKKPKRRNKRNYEEEYEDKDVHPLSEIKRNMHRESESKRRQLENSAIDNLKSYISTSKKYLADPTERYERVHLLTNAASFIQENVSTLNILLGVLCTTLLNSQEVQPAIHFAMKDENNKYSNELICDTFNVPSSIEALMDELIRKKFGNDADNQFFPRME